MYSIFRAAERSIAQLPCVNGPREEGGAGGGVGGDGAGGGGLAFQLLYLN